MRNRGAWAVVGGQVYYDLQEISRDISVLDSDGKWICHFPYDGEPVFARFKKQTPLARRHNGCAVVSDGFESDTTRDEFIQSVRDIKEKIRDGDVYQVNLCRILSAPLIDSDLLSFATRLTMQHPTKHNMFLQLPSEGIAIVCASPETYLKRDGNNLYSEPIKGTRALNANFLGKDVAENIMIVDLVRNDMGRLCEYGTVRTPILLQEEPSPGLSHLVSGVTGVLRPSTSWAEIQSALFQPGSVTGAPKIAACQMIDSIEKSSRGSYCGALGIVDADARTAELALTIRTFWRDGDQLKFGTGAGITIDSDPGAEWDETELKARTLIEIATNVRTPERETLRRAGSANISL